MDNTNKCLECSRIFPKEAGLHLHIVKGHRLPLGHYYYRHFPRHDKYDGSPLVYKDRHSYMTDDFNTRHTMRKWFQTALREEVCLYIREFWSKRKIEKHLVLAPSQVEIRSLNMPGKKTMNELFGDYNDFFNELGLCKRFENETFSGVFHDTSKQRIIVDSREQKPLEFDAPIRTAALKFGDYRLSNNTISSDCYIERKSIMDFHGTLAKDRPRFEREIQRASDAGAYLVVVVEGAMENVYDFANSSFFNRPPSEARQRPTSISSPQYVFKNMRELMQKFTNLQFLFVKDRESAAKIIEKLFASGGEFKKIDLQFAYDTNTLL